MSGVGKVNTGWITHTGHYLQDEWCRKGQYRMDYTNRPLSTEWVVMSRTIQDGLHRQAIVYRICGVGEVNAGWITQ